MKHFRLIQCILCMVLVLLFIGCPNPIIDDPSVSSHPVFTRGEMYYPIIFVHGIESDATQIVAWRTWDNTNSAMMKILNTGYGGYKAGSPIKCDKNTQLKSMPDSERIYNFSYYFGSGSYRGVIGSNGRYYSASYTDDYNTSASNACWAEHLADFIDKVITATGASKVNIVAHSMGGVVARAAIAYYGCENKVRKLLTVGTPNKTFENDVFVEALVANLLPGYQGWQKKGELLELGVNYWGPVKGGVLFRDANDFNTVATYLDWLAANEPQVPTACIAGDKEQWYTAPFDDNDGFIPVKNAHLGYAQFNPTIYAAHARSQADWDEQALPTCTFTTEFIKKWIIDDEGMPRGQVTGGQTKPPIYSIYELKADFNINNILCTVLQVSDELGRTAYGKRVFAWETGGWGDYRSPVICTDPDLFPITDEFLLDVKHQDMITGDIDNDIKFQVYKLNDAIKDNAYVHLNTPSPPYKPGKKIKITNIDLGANYPIDTIYKYKWENGSYQECILDANGYWIVPSPPSPEGSLTQCKIKVVVKLDPVTSMSDEITISAGESFTNPSPPDGIKGVEARSHGSPIFVVSAHFPDANPRDVYFYGRRKGSSWDTKNPIHVYKDVKDGDKAYAAWPNRAYGTTYEWYAESPPYKSNIFSFTTEAVPNPAPKPPYNPRPANGATGVSCNPVLRVDVIDPNMDYMDVTFYARIDNSTMKIGTDNNVQDGSTASVTWRNRKYGETYTWWAVADDHNKKTKSPEWTFTVMVC